ncbi:MAG: hypothetical protein COA86_04020 [Kangiella sp.]|nr:MAG: hypothetical protein COA86_04790 [Kangiella sp.]PHS19925.1 MAG: hypothetical protein COA86_04020 [Kangiella sp.]
MKNINILWSAIVFSICFSIELSSLSAKQIPINILSKTPEVRDVQISPNGEYFSVIFRKDGRDLLGVLDRNTKKPINLFGVKGQGKSIGAVYWINNERLIHTIVKSSKYNTTIFDYGEINAINVDGSRKKAIFGYQSGEKQTGTRIKKKRSDRAWFDIIDLLENDDKHILISVLPWQIDLDEVKPEVFKLNVYSGRKKKTGKLPGRWGMTDNNGNLRFSWRVNDNNRLVIYYKEAKLNAPIGDWQTFDVKDFDYQKIFPLAFTKDNKSVYLNVTIKDKTSALHLLNLEEQSIEKIYQHDLVDTSDYIFDFDTSNIVAVRNDFGKPSYEYLDKKNAKGKLHRILSKAFPNNHVGIVSATKDNSYVVVSVTSDTNSGDYYLFSTKTLNADYIISASPWLDPAEMANMEPQTFEMRDGVTIHGYLTKPKVYKGKLPLVVMPHGGPHGRRDYWGFNYEVQLLANRGYAVLQVNFRGSGGFGLGFKEKGHGEWGALMQDDLTDATI